MVEIENHIFFRAGEACRRREMDVLVLCLLEAGPNFDRGKQFELCRPKAKSPEVRK